VAQRYCTNCGNDLRDGDVFCASCGKPAHETAAVATPEADVDVPPPPPQQAGGTPNFAPTSAAPPTEKPRISLTTFLVLVILAIVGIATLFGQDGAQKKRPEVDPERGMGVLWEGYEEPKETLSKRHPEPEAKKVIRLTGDAAPVTLSGFHSCGKFFVETVRPPFEAKVPYCNDRWESGWVGARTRAEGDVKLELLVDGEVQQTTSLSNKRRLEDEESTEDLVLRPPEKGRTSKNSGE